MQVWRLHFVMPQTLWSRGNHTLHLTWHVICWKPKTWPWLGWCHFYYSKGSLPTCSRVICIVYITNWHLWFNTNAMTFSLRLPEIRWITTNVTPKQIGRANQEFCFIIVCRLMRSWVMWKGKYPWPVWSLETQIMIL